MTETKSSKWLHTSASKDQDGREWHVWWSCVGDFEDVSIYIRWPVDHPSAADHVHEVHKLVKIKNDETAKDAVKQVVEAIAAGPTSGMSKRVNPVLKSYQNSS